MEVIVTLASLWETAWRMKPAPTTKVRKKISTTERIDVGMGNSRVNRMSHSSTTKMLGVSEVGLINMQTNEGKIP